MSCYAQLKEFLQQGDVFRAPLVAPITDSQQRIFRSLDGRHGSVVFAGSAEGKIFSREELITALQTAVRGALHTQPFEATPDGQREFVVTNADLIEFFVVVSQTCDICGVDKPAHPLSMILKAKSMRNLCRTEPLPFKGESSPLTIHDYLKKKIDVQNLDEASEHDYPGQLRETYHRWQPKTNEEKANRGQINNYLTRMQKQAGVTYFLEPDSDLEVPPLYIDFLTAFTVTTAQLDSMRPQRICTLAETHRIAFAQAFAFHISRVALPAPMKADSALG